MKNRTATAGLALSCALLMGACDVTNPGPVEDSTLTNKDTHRALVNGAGRRLQEAINNISYTSALPSREIFPGGQTGAHGHAVLVQGGYIEPGSFGGHFNDAVQAYYIAETALDLFATVEGTEDEADPEVIQQAHVWAGYAHRLLGENWCEAVFEGGPAEPGIGYFERAEAHFTDAIDNAADPELVLAAYAGRAQARVWLGDWAGAAADAGMITGTNWSYDVMSVSTEADTRNMLHHANADRPYRAYTMWYTYYGGSDDTLLGVADNANPPPAFAGYYELTGDPRVRVLPQSTTTPYSNAALSGYGQTPFLNQDKYTSGDDDFRLASSQEMRLIEAEALLHAGDPAGALAIIDALRASYRSDHDDAPLGRIPDVLGGFAEYDGWTTTPTTVEEVMSHLMRERGIELWGEARRWGDLRRWEDGQSLGGDVQFEPFEYVSNIFAQAAQEAADADARGFPNRLRCFDIPNGEREANPNLPTVN